MLLPSQLPKRGRASVHRKRRRKRILLHAIFVTLIVSCALLWTVGVFLWAQSVMVHPQRHKEHKGPPEDTALPIEVYELWPDDYDSPEFFQTLKSCNPRTGGEKKCLEFIPEGTKTQRIALLRPPGSLGHIFTKFVQETVRLHSNNETDLVLIPTSHVPPYGYGKTHGYTKIIRFAAMPLALAAADMANHEQEDASVEDLKQIVRQLLRWHCRLSHVAAHTSLMTLTLEDLVEDPWEMEIRVGMFLDLLETKADTSQNPPQNHVLEGEHIDEDEVVSSIMLIVRHAGKLLCRLEPSRDGPKKVEAEIKNVINDELRRTDNLRHWPCLSFWNVGEGMPYPALSPLAHRIAHEFAPNCTAEYSECTVPKDRCETKGDPVC